MFRKFPRGVQLVQEFKLTAGPRVCGTASDPMRAAGASTSLSGLSRKRDLWWQFTVRSIESRYRGSYLGILWSVLNPVLMLGIYFTVFGIIFSGHFRDPAVESRTDFAMSMFLGLTLYSLLADSLGTGPLQIVGNVNLVKKVVFPLEILPLSQAGSLWFNLLIGLLLALGGSAFFGSGLSLVGLAWLPLILFPLLMLCAGLSLLLAALGVFFRDLAQAMPFVAQVVLYASAVFYPVSRIPPHVWAFLKWNPFLQTVVLARTVILWGMPVNVRALAYTYVAGFAVLLFGHWVFQKLRSAFADVL
jgi:lipopolysaccharide transport system permease protein